MNKLCLALLESLAGVPGTARQATLLANITGNEVDGKCTIEMSVDGAAEVEVRGNARRSHLSTMALSHVFSARAPMPLAVALIIVPRSDQDLARGSVDDTRTVEP
jgi:hypothetical protein